MIHLPFFSFCNQMIINLLYFVYWKIIFSTQR